MSSVNFFGDRCGRCGKNHLSGYQDCRSGEREYGCAACGEEVRFQFRRDEHGIVHQTHEIPLGDIRLTARARGTAENIREASVIWRTDIPACADTDFLYLFLNGRKEELRQRYPAFDCTPLYSIERKGQNGTLWCIERLLNPAEKGGEMQLKRLNFIGNQFELQRDQGNLRFLEAQYDYHHRQGHGVAFVRYLDGSKPLFQVMAQGTTVEQADRIWNEHVNQNTDYSCSYLTLMRAGTLHVLRGNLD